MEEQTPRAENNCFFFKHEKVTKILLKMVKCQQISKSLYYVVNLQLSKWILDGPFLQMLPNESAAHRVSDITCQSAELFFCPSQRFSNIASTAKADLQSCKEHGSHLRKACSWRQCCLEYVNHILCFHTKTDQSTEMYHLWL